MIKKCLSCPHSNLYWYVYSVIDLGNKVKLKLLFRYKSSNEICYWLNSNLRSKWFTLEKKNITHWKEYVRSA